jgi:hypothetical protein
MPQVSTTFKRELLDWVHRTSKKLRVDGLTEYKKTIEVSLAPIPGMNSQDFIESICAACASYVEIWFTFCTAR